MKSIFLWIGILFASAAISSCSSPAKRPKTPPAATKGSELDGDLPASAPTVNQPTKSRYQVIQDGFDQSLVMPTVDDFDSVDEPNPNVKCISVKSSNPNSLNEVVIKQTILQVSGLAGYGPLFPGTLDHGEVRLVMGKNNGWVNSQKLTNEIRAIFELNKEPGSLVIRINENKFGIYQDVSAPAEVWIRKDARNYIFFKVYQVASEKVEKVRNEVFIGYCYRHGASLEVH